MSELYILVPEKPSNTLQKMINAAVQGRKYKLFTEKDELPELKKKKIIFAVELNDAGISLGLDKMLTAIYNRGKDSLKGSVGGVLIHSNTELYTKTVAQRIIFLTNQLGLYYPGRSMVEATNSLKNFLTMQKVSKKPLMEVCLEQCSELGYRLEKEKFTKVKSPKILALHASDRRTSNTLTLWDMVKNHLENCSVNEIHIENGTVKDCKGCSYKICKHYGQQTSCFYGGIMVEEVYPAILDSDILIWLCPNYNDAISANLSAVINRLTALFRKTKFYDKSIYSIIVSGNSGSDAVAKQLISALNINKTFKLPPYFALMATANDRGAIRNIPNIELKAREFAMNILNKE